MRKAMFLSALVLLLLIVGCSNEESKSNLTMDSFISAFTAQGVEVDKNEKPMFDMIGAKDGVIFYLDSKPVKIYQYESTKELNKAKKENELIKDWASNGNFLLESKNEEAKKIFEGVK